MSRRIRSHVDGRHGQRALWYSEGLSSDRGRCACGVVHFPGEAGAVHRRQELEAKAAAERERQALVVQVGRRRNGRTRT